jgi:DNA polymerase-3 subunit alpha
VIERTGYPLYFLIVADYGRFVRERGILALPRGSVAGSICIYALGICDVDPLRYALMFEPSCTTSGSGCRTST